MSIDMIINNKLKSKSKCPICKIPLSINNIDRDYEYQYCSSCRREYYPLNADNQQKLEYDDIETVSEDGEEPILLSEKSKESKPDSYLRRHFGSSVNIETEIYIPE